MTSQGKVAEIRAKVVMLGDSGVGKSCIGVRFLTTKFDSRIESTIGNAFYAPSLVIDDQTVKFNIWDTAGQERYRSIAPLSYRGAGGAILVFDITCRESFNSLASWVKELQERGPKDIVLCVCGNKTDLESSREARRFADGAGALYVEVSAKARDGFAEIQRMFTEVYRAMPASAREPIPPSTDQLPDLGTRRDRSQRARCC